MGRFYHAVRDSSVVVVVIVVAFREDIIRLLFLQPSSLTTLLEISRS